MKVKNVVIGAQKEKYDNIDKLLEIVNKKKINLILVNKGDRIYIEKHLYINVLWPNKEELIAENGINNNSLVFKLIYRDCSILFTGDIEQLAEKKILQDNINLKATILKIAHHGSKTSSIQEFIERVNPQMVLIGVGKGNKFGHPNSEVINKFEKIGARIYRTDLDGEIIIKFNHKSKINITRKR